MCGQDVKPNVPFWTFMTISGLAVGLSCSSKCSWADLFLLCFITETGWQLNISYGQNQCENPIQTTPNDKCHILNMLKWLHSVSAHICWRHSEEASNNVRWIQHGGLSVNGHWAGGSTVPGYLYWEQTQGLYRRSQKGILCMKQKICYHGNADKRTWHSHFVLLHYVYIF